MERLNVSTEQIVATGTSVAEHAHALKGEIATMESILGEIKASWSSSEAAPRFARVMEEHLIQATSLAQALLSQGDGLSLAGRTMTEAESVLAQSIPAV